MAAILELIRTEPLLPSPAPDVCDELCAAVDEAVTLEEALRGVMRTLCMRLGWNAGRATHHDARPVWHVDRHQSIPALRRVVGRVPAVVWHEPWTVTRSSALWTVTFPIEWSAGAYLEMYSLEPPGTPNDVLDDVARALSPVGTLLHRKRGEKLQQAARERDRQLFLSSPVPCFVVSADGAIQMANHAASVALGFSPHELAAMRFDQLVCGEQRKLPESGATQLMRQRTRAGGEIVVEVRTHPHQLDDGAPGSIVIATDVTDRLLAEQRLEVAAFTDALTGLHNRAAFERHLAMATERARSGALFAVLFIDLDRFKSVNDNYGHAAGDALLCEVARRLRSTLRSGDLAARLGGDEFTALLPLRDLAEAIPITERLQNRLLQPARVGGSEIVPGASIGVAFAGPTVSTAAAVLREADAAMYRAKAKGTGNVVFASFAPGLRG